MIRLDRHGRILSSGFDGESLPSYADEVTHGLGEGKPAGEKVRSLMTKIAAKRKEKAKKTAVAIAIEAQSKQAFKNLLSAKRLSEQAKKAQRIENAKAKVKIAASKQRSIGFDFSGLIGDPLAGFDDTATILASSGLLGEGLYDDVIEGEDFGNTTLGAAPKKKVVAKNLSDIARAAPKAAPKPEMKTAMNDFAARQRDAIAAQAKKEEEELAKWAKLGKEAGINDPKMAKQIGEKKLKEMASKRQEFDRYKTNAKKQLEQAARKKLPAGKLTDEQEAIYNVFFIQEALKEAAKYHDTNKKFKWLVREIEGWLKYLDKNTDKLKGEQRKDADNNRNFIKNEFEKAKVKAIERTIDWRKKNGKCGFLGLDCVYPPSPLLIIGAAVLIVGTIATGGALLGGIASVASSVGSATAGVAGTVGGVAGSAASAVGLGALAPVATTLGTTAAAGAIGKAGESLIPKEVKGITQVAGVVSGSGGSLPSAGDLASSGLKAAQAEGERRVQGAVKEAVSLPERKIAEEKARATAKIEHAKKLPKKVKDKAIADTKANAKKLAVADVAKKTGLPVASIQAVADGKTPPTPVIPSVAELAQKEVKATQEVALATLQEKTGIQTGVENPVWSAKDIAEEVSPQALKAGGFAPVQAQAKIANAAEGLGVKISDAPDLSLSKEDRNRLAAEVAKSELAVQTEKYDAVVKAGKNLELAKKSNLPAASIKSLELQYAEAVAQYEKAKLTSGVKVAAAAQGRLDDSNRHPMARFF